jgi:hypothetical protein
MASLGLRRLLFGSLLACVCFAGFLPYTASAGVRLPEHNRGVLAENALPGTSGWDESPDGPTPAVEAYASEPSVLPGEPVHLHVSIGPAGDYYRTKIFRLGWYGGSGARLYECVPSCSTWQQGQLQSHPAPDRQTGEVRADWPVTDVIPTSIDWPSGMYLARVERQGSDRTTSVIFVVRELPLRSSQVLVEVPINTWEAYNGWGGKSLYPESSRGAPANRVSFDRPWGPGTQQQFFAWGIQLVRFLESRGYDVSYTTDVDVDRDPAQLQHHRLVIVDGHGEYWTSTMRDAFGAARDAGTNLAFVGANIAYWQVRYERDRRTIVGYKSSADPTTDPRLQTVMFRALSTPRFECQLLGVQHQGAYSHAGDPSVAYTVTPAAANDPWFAGTGLAPGDVLPDLVGPEWDQVIGGDRTPTCNPRSLTVLFHADSPRGSADAVRYTAPSGARVFSAGSLQFAWGLDGYAHPLPPDPRVGRFMVNVLDDLTRPAPPSLTAAMRGPAVVLATSHPADPRASTLILRHRGLANFDVSDPEAVVLCVADTVCVDRKGASGLYRYAAVTIDSWGVSAPVYAHSPGID